MRRLPVILLLFALIAPSALRAQSSAIRVDRIDPPNWWVGLRTDTLQLMLSGANLHGITARFADDRIRVSSVQTVDNASYAWINVTVPPDAPAGTYPLEIRKGTDVQTVPYLLKSRATAPSGHRGFGPDDVVYLIMPDRFSDGDPGNNVTDDTRPEYDPQGRNARHGGDLQGLIDRLDYLDDLGITAIWLTPVLENRGRFSYHGYAATDLYRIDPRLGSNDDYVRFVAEAHQRGIKVIFDHVNNHIGIEHDWLSNLPTPDWVNDRTTPTSHYKLAVTDPYADPESVRRLKDFWFVGSMPDLNQRQPLLATYLIQNTIWWIETTGIDGIREDTYPYPDQAYLKAWARAILDEYPEFNIVGEIWEGEPAYIAAFQAGSTGPGAIDTALPSVMDFALTDAMRAYLDGSGRIERIYRVLAQDFVYADPSQLLTFFDNHDISRGIHAAGGNVNRVKQMLAVLLTTRGIPQLLYGTEFGIPGGESHDALRFMPPPEAFTESGRSGTVAELHAFTRTLLRIRKQHHALRHGRLVHWQPQWNSDIYRFVRITDTETIVVIINGHDEERTVDLKEMADFLIDGAPWTDLLTDTVSYVSLEHGMQIPARGVHVLRLAP